MNVCITPGCGNGQVCRGVCKACYEAAYRLVHNKTTTWRHLELAGLVLRPSPIRKTADGYYTPFAKEWRRKLASLLNSSVEKKLA